jgi:hypothetical protein
VGIISVWQFNENDSVNNTVADHAVENAVEKLLPNFTHMLATRPTQYIKE